MILILKLKASLLSYPAPHKPLKWYKCSYIDFGSTVINWVQFAILKKNYQRRYIFG